MNGPDRVLLCLEVQAGIVELFTSKYRPFCDQISYGKLNLNLDVASCELVSVFDEKRE